ncbi:MAG: ATP-binding cassette domain-containing protein [Oscillospiraceae bacterium]|nr:ATP-binding cassette domain-containing protein [Oscillospiraceae bacterium]
MNYVLQTHGLTKKYGRKNAVDAVDMNISAGDIYGFVGENGSGKTTVIRLITGLIRANSGYFELFGADSRSSAINEARRKLGAIVETPSIYRNMSARDNLRMQSAILGIEDEDRINEVLTTVGLSAVADDKKKAGNFSLGMRQRLGIAMALLGDPDFLILDEPMNGLDPAGIVEVRELILRLNREKNMTFLISSHILTELSLVATKYGVISSGKLIKEITAEELKAECGKVTRIEAKDRDALFELLKSLLPENLVITEDKGVKIMGDADIDSILRAVIASNNRIESVNCSDVGFEEYYLELLGGKRK